METSKLKSGDHNTQVWVNKHGLGLRVNTIRGWWVSLGLHLDFKHKHIDLYFLWWVFIVGNTNEPIHCRFCGTELDGGEMLVCPDCELPPPFEEEHWVFETQEEWGAF